MKTICLVVSVVLLLIATLASAGAITTTLPWAFPAGVLAFVVSFLVP